jgi:hypothetical protein
MKFRISRLGLAKAVDVAEPGPRHSVWNATSSRDEFFQHDLKRDRALALANKILGGQRSGNVIIVPSVTTLQALRQRYPTPCKPLSSLVLCIVPRRPLRYEGWRHAPSNIGHRT